MARVHRVPSSRIAHRCGKGHEIPKGEGYTWAAPGYRGRKQYRCAQHPFRPSELTTSLASGPLSALESLEDAVAAMDPTTVDTLAELETAVEEFAQAVRDYADERQQALDAWEHGNSQLEDLVYTAEQAAEEAEQISVESFDDEEPEEPGEEPNADEEPDVHQTWTELAEEYEAWEESRTEHVQGQMDAVLDAAQSIGF